MRTALKILLFPIKLAWKIVSWVMVRIIMVISVFYEVLGNYIIGTLGFVGGILWICFLGMLLFGKFETAREGWIFLGGTCAVTAVPALLFFAGESFLTRLTEFLLDSDDWLWNLCSN